MLTYIFIYTKGLAGKADLLILTQYPIVIAYSVRAPKGQPSFPSDDVTELNELENKMMMERIR